MSRDLVGGNKWQAQEEHDEIAKDCQFGPDIMGG